jgi:hypothetical protein
VQAISIQVDWQKYYKPTASGWVQALPSPDFWGSLQSLARQRVLATYPRRDADVGETTFTLKILSPHLSGLPTDDRSRQELYRAIEIQVVRELVGCCLTQHLSPVKAKAHSILPGRQMASGWLLLRAVKSC